jgi:hypothetical protein
MKRIGKYTGTIYDESINPKTIQECCVMKDNPTQNDINKAKFDCLMCPGDKNCMKGKQF